MDSVKGFPDIMANAREDFTANVRGQFSPEDWQAILSRAHEKWVAQMATPGCESETAAWQAVVLDFYRNNQWGFDADYNPRKDPKRKKKNSPLHFILFLFLTFTFTKIAVVWSGQIYTFSDEPWDAYVFYTVLAVVFLNLVFFLWRNWNHEDQPEELADKAE